MGKLDLSDFAEFGKYYQREVNPYILALCPFHADSSPSMIIHQDGYKCKSCGARGSLTYLYSKLTLSSYIPYRPESLWSEIFSEYRNLDNFWEAAYRRAELADFNIPYLSARGLRGDGYGVAKGAVVIPSFDISGKLVGVILRSMTPRFRYLISPRFGSSIHIPKLSYSIDAEYTFVTFGVLDAETLAQQGVPAVSSVFGQNVKAKDLQAIVGVKKILPDLKEESSGLALANSLGLWGEFINPRDVLGGCKDVNEYWVQNKRLPIDIKCHSC